jgi:hypothetical protein
MLYKDLTVTGKAWPVAMRIFDNLQKTVNVSGKQKGFLREIALPFCHKSLTFARLSISDRPVADFLSPKSAIRNFKF